MGGVNPFLVHAAAAGDSRIFLSEDISFTPGLRIGKEVPGECYEIKVVDPDQSWPSRAIWVKGTLTQAYPAGSSVEPYAQP